MTIAHEYFSHLCLLGTCPNLATLKLHHSGIDELHNVPTALDKAKVWLSDCKSLRTLEVFHRYGPEFVTGALIDENVPIRSLELTPDTRSYSKSFYEALTTKSSIKELRIRFFRYADIHQVNPKKSHNHFWESILTLHSLQSLYVKADWLTDDDIKHIAERLGRLQCLKLHNHHYLTDATWDSLSSMPILTSFIQGGSSHFTLKGILSFINKLGPGNRGFHLEVNTPSRYFTEAELASTRSLLNSKVGGTIEVYYFEPMMLRRLRGPVRYP